MADIISFPKPKPKKKLDEQILLPSGKFLIQYVQNYELMKAALQKIAAMPYDDKEMEELDEYGKKQYYWLTHTESSENLSDAVEIAYRVLMERN